MEIRQSPLERLEGVDIEQIAFRAGPVEEANRTLLTALHMIAQDGPEGRHPRSPTHQQHRAGLPFAAKARAVGPLGRQPVSRLKSAVEQRGKRTVWISFDNE